MPSRYFPTRVGVTQSSKEAASAWLTFFPTLAGISTQNRGGNPSMGSLPSLAWGQGAVISHSLTIAHTSTSSAASRTSAWICSRSQSMSASA